MLNKDGVIPVTGFPCVGVATKEEHVQRATYGANIHTFIHHLYTVHDMSPRYTFEACISERNGSLKEINDRRGRRGSSRTRAGS